MDHLIAGLRAEGVDLDVPHLCGDIDWNSNLQCSIPWPVQSGAVVKDSKDILTIARWCQRHVWFETLALILEEFFNRESFVRTTDDGQVLDTSLLPKLLDDHLTCSSLEITTSLAVEASHFGEQIWKHIKKAQEYFNEYITPYVRAVETKDADGWPGSVAKGHRPESIDHGLYKVFLAADVLVDTIVNHLKENSTVFADRLRDKSITNFTHETYGITRCFMPGICPSIPKRLLLSSLEALQLYCLPFGDESYTHEHCSKDCCFRFNIEESTYETRHTDCCLDTSCDFQQVDQLLLIDIISSGHLPLVSSHQDRHGKLTIDIIAAPADARYAAFSHVWAGGLGNFQSNALPSCQLAQLHSLVDNDALAEPLGRFRHLQEVYELYRWAVHSEQNPKRKSNSTRLYWLDTLCIPLTSPAHRLAAINVMAKTYAAANEVLVLDPVLQRIECGNLKESVVDLVVASSPWMARSWTLQEGAVAFNLKFRFADGLRSFKKIAAADSLLSDSGLEKLWSMESTDPSLVTQSSSLLGYATKVCVDAVLNRPPTVQNAISAEDAACHRFIEVWNDLAARTTTKSDDIASILAVLLHRSSEEVLGLRQEDRMWAVLTCHAKLPVSLLTAPWLSGSPHWTPEFPNSPREIHRLDMMDGSMRLTKDGLILDTAECLRRSTEQLPASNRFVLHDSTTQTRYLIFRPDEVSARQSDSSRLQIFWFGATRHSRSSLRWGLCFVLIDDCAGVGMRVRLQCRFLWQQSNSQLIQSGDDGELDVISTDGSTNQSYISSVHPLIIDIATIHKPVLQWSRLQAFPYVELAFGQEQILDLIPVISIFSWVLAYFTVTFPKTSGFCGDNTLVAWGAELAALAGITLTLGSGLAVYEYDLLRTAETRFLQSIWAQTFSHKSSSVRLPREVMRQRGTKSELRQKIFSARKPIFIIAALAIHIFAAVALILASLYSWKQLSNEQMKCGNGVRILTWTPIYLICKVSAIHTTLPVVILTWYAISYYCISLGFIPSSPRNNGMRQRIVRFAVLLSYIAACGYFANNARQLIAFAYEEVFHSPEDAISLRIWSTFALVCGGLTAIAILSIGIRRFVVPSVRQMLAYWKRRWRRPDREIQLPL